MSWVNSLSLHKWRKFVFSPHFWVLTAILIFVSMLYYSWIFPRLRPDWFFNLFVTEIQYNFTGILFFIPLIYALVVFQWRGMLIIGLIETAIITPLSINYRPFLVIANVYYLCIPLFIAGYVALEFNRQNRERKALLESEQLHRAYVAYIFQAQEDERKRIAQELHDDTIHSLLFIGNKVNHLSDITVGEKRQMVEQMKVRTKEIRDDLIRTSNDLRNLTLNLRPSIIDEMGFYPALRWLVERLHQEGRIDTKIITKGIERKIPHNIDVIVFRVVQEALNNVRVHSQATEANVILEYYQRKIIISVCDNGKGFTLPKKIESFASMGKIGLTNIAERVNYLNGEFHIESKLGQGTTISVVLSGI